MQYPEVKRRVFGHSAQSASENPYKFSELCDKIQMPKSIVPLMYRNILLTGSS